MKRLDRYQTRLFYYGWQSCQTCCPFNNDRFVQVTAEPDYRPDWREAEDRPTVPDGPAGDRGAVAGGAHADEP
ncbi:MAG: hypothetical protein LC667_05250 [Thioalkalivibrio sp.]|nr:hypothetical protein [Thioalkalivibrio sp.]